MLAGEPPFTGPHARAIIARQLTEHPRSVRALRPDTPPAVEQAIARALAKDPQDRFSTVAQFLEALEAVDSPRADAALLGTTRGTRGAAVRQHEPRSGNGLLLTTGSRTS